MVVPNLYAGDALPKGAHRWGFCYLHGEAENVFPESDNSSPDIFTADQHIPARPGSYPVLIDGQPAIAIIAENHGSIEGRVVLIHDFKALQHACKPKDWR